MIKLALAALLTLSALSAADCFDRSSVMVFDDKSGNLTGGVNEEGSPLTWAPGYDGLSYLWVRYAGKKSDVQVTTWDTLTSGKVVTTVFARKYNTGSEVAIRRYLRCGSYAQSGIQLTIYKPGTSEVVKKIVVSVGLK